MKELSLEQTRQLTITYIIARYRAHSNNLSRINRTLVVIAVKIVELVTSDRELEILGGRVGSWKHGAAVERAWRTIRSRTIYVTCTCEKFMALWFPFAEMSYCVSHELVRSVNLFFFCNTKVCVHAPVDDYRFHMKHI